MKEIVVYKGFEVHKDGSLRSLLRHFFSRTYNSGPDARGVIDELTRVYEPRKWIHSSSPLFVFNSLGDAQETMAMFSFSWELWKCVTRKIHKISFCPSWCFVKECKILGPMRITHPAFRPTTSVLPVVLTLKLAECIHKHDGYKVYSCGERS